MLIYYIRPTLTLILINVCKSSKKQQVGIPPVCLINEEEIIVF